MRRSCVSGRKHLHKCDSETVIYCFPKLLKPGDRMPAVPRTHFALIVLLIVLCNIAGPVFGADLSDRVPEMANVVMVLDVKKMLDTPLARTEAWQSKLTSG